MCVHRTYIVKNLESQVVVKRRTGYVEGCGLFLENKSRNFLHENLMPQRPVYARHVEYKVVWAGEHGVGSFEKKLASGGNASAESCSEFASMSYDDYDDHVQWVKTERRLREDCISPALHAAHNDLVMSVHDFARGHDLVYDLCLNSPRSERFYNSRKCYAFVQYAAEANVLPPGGARVRFLTLMEHMFSAVDRFYASWLSMPNVYDLMEKIMDDLIASDLFRVRLYFAFWAHDPCMLARRFHPEGPYAKRVFAKHSAKIY